jgi:hypothetical protein
MKLCKLVGSTAPARGHPFTARHEQPERILKIPTELQNRTLNESPNANSPASGAVWWRTPIIVELRGQPPLLLGLFRDVTLQKGLEDQLRSQKMADRPTGRRVYRLQQHSDRHSGHASLLLSGRLAGGRSPPNKSSTPPARGGIDAAAHLRSPQVMRPRPLDSTLRPRCGPHPGRGYCAQRAIGRSPARHRGSSMMEQVREPRRQLRDAMPGGQLSIRISVEFSPQRGSTRRRPAGRCLFDGERHRLHSPGELPDF